MCECGHEASEKIKCCSVNVKMKRLSRLMVRGKFIVDTVFVWAHEVDYFTLIWVYFMCVYIQFNKCFMSICVCVPSLIRRMSFPRSLVSFISRGVTGSQGHMDDPACILSLHSYIIT